MAFGPLDAILLFGDSLTQSGWDQGGFVQRLAYVYGRKLDVVNRGLSGYNTEWAMPVFKQILPKRREQETKIKILTLWFGANDSCIQPSPQYLTMERFLSNLKEMIAMIQAPESLYYSPETRIILITPPPVDEKARGADLASRNPPQALDRKASNTKLYSDAVTDLGRTLNLPVADVYAAISLATGGNDDNLGTYLSDGLHLTQAGNAIVFDTLVKVIADSMPELHFDRLPMAFPPWKELINVSVVD